MKFKINTSIFLLLALFVNFSYAQDHDHGHDHNDPDVVIHRFKNGESWKNCSFIVHSSLTQAQFKQFTKEAGSIIYFQPLSGASSLGKFKFDVGISMSSTPIDQTSGGWNNTFAHPADDVEEGPHWLGDVISIPNLRFRMGLTDNIEIGSYLTRDFSANYGFFGTDVKYTHALNLAELFLAARVSYSQMFGPESLKLSNTSTDVLISKKLFLFEPYVGYSFGLNHAQETSNQVQLNSINIFSNRLIIGTKIKYKWAIGSLEYDFSEVNTFSFKFGVTF